MKIGLTRHFKVDKDYIKGLVEAKDFSQWMKEYDHHDVFIKDVDLRGVEWNKCYASDLPRAITTAETIYKGDIEKTPLIREILMQFTDNFDKNIKRKVEFQAWSVYSMVNWAKDNDRVVKETISKSRERVNEFLDGMLKDSSGSDRILIVCHGMIMTILEEQLRLRGFTGETVVSAQNGEVFLMEN